MDGHEEMQIGIHEALRQACTDSFILPRVESPLSDEKLNRVVGRMSGVQ